MKKSYYRILHISDKARPSDIKKAYRSAVKKHHPDVSPHDEEKFKQIQEAYETLSDPGKRALYDRQTSEKPLDPTGSIRTYWPEGFRDSLIDDMDHLFSGLEGLWMRGPENVWRRPGKSCTRCRGTGRVRGLICGRCRGLGEERSTRP